jgi:hypothetical protein
MVIQPKLTLGAVGDKYEQEADQVAKQVVGQINAGVSQPSGRGQSVQRSDEHDALRRTPDIQRLGTAEGATVDSGIESAITQAQGGGLPLAEGVRAPMERAFGANFSGVRVHTSAQSDRLNHSLQARAFTTGQDIFFRQAEYNPSSSGGQQLLAHELTHVVQQTQARVGTHNNGLALQPKSEQVIQRARGKRKAEDEPEKTGKKTKLDLDFGSVVVSRRDISDHKQAATIGVKVQIGSERRKDIKQLPEEIVDDLIKQKDWYKKDRTILTTLTTDTPRDVTVMTDDPEKFERALAIKYLIVHEEAEPRSGKSRAAANEQTGKSREPAPVEAAYEEANKKPFHSDINNKNALSEFKVEDNAKGGKLKVTMVHKGSWGKGQRDPSQSGVMKGQNAKNYVVANDPNLKHKRDGGSSLDKIRQEIGGRYEWLHIIGSSLGGLNTLGNLVAGSYDANTKMIALEHRVALWGKQDYKGDFEPTASNPITITGEAEVYPNTYVGKSIRLEVKHGTKKVSSGDYDLDSQTVITRSQYEDEEKRVGSEIDSAR